MTGELVYASRSSIPRPIAETIATAINNRRRSTRGSTRPIVAGTALRYLRSMLRKHASLIIAISLIALVATACIIRTRRPPPTGYQAQPVYVEKHKEPKHEKHKKHK